MGVHKTFSLAAAEHRSAAVALERARGLLPRLAAGAEDDPRQRELARRLAQAAALSAPGWLGQALPRAAEDLTVGHAHAEAPLSVRIGVCRLDSGARFPALANLLGTGHLVLDAQVERPEAVALLSATPLRLLAARPAETLSVECAALDAACFDAFAPLVEAGLVGVRRGVDGLEALLGVAEAQLERARRGGDPADLPERLLVLAQVPHDSDVEARLRSLAADGPRARVHVIAAGWGDREPLPAATLVRLRDDAATVSGIPVPVKLDPAPTPELLSSAAEVLGASRNWSIEDLA